MTTLTLTAESRASLLYRCLQWAVLPLFIGVSGNAWCALIEGLGVTPVAMSLGNAVTADPPTVVDAVHFNPAGLSHFDGRWISGSIIGVDFDASSSFVAPEGYSIGGFKDDPVVGAKTSGVDGYIYVPGGGGTKVSLPGLLPASFGFSYSKPESRWTFAAAVFPEMVGGLSKKDKSSDPSRFYGREGTFQRLTYFSPSFSYQLTDTLSLGMSVAMSHVAMAGELDVRLPNPVLGILGTAQGAWCPETGGNPLDFLVGLCAGLPEGTIDPFESAGLVTADLTASLDVTYNIGVLWEPYEWLALGGVYRSGSDTILTGDVDVDYAPWVTEAYRGLNSGLAGAIIIPTLGLPSEIPERQSMATKVKIPFPERIQIGLKVRPIPKLQINLDAYWADWGKWDEIVFEFDQPVAALEIYRIFSDDPPDRLVVPRGYESVIHYSMGLQYQVNNSLVLRAGYEPRKSSIPEDKLDLIALAPDVDIYSLGLGYTTRSGLKIDFGAGYASGDYDVPANGSCNLNCEKFDNFVYNPYAGLDVSAEVEAIYVGLTVSKQF